MVGNEQGDLNAQAPPEGATTGGMPFRPGVRLLLLGLILAAVFVAGKASGLLDSISPESLRALLASAGVFGVLVFVAVFSLGLLAQLPGLLFVAVAVLAYGREVGAIVALGGSIVAVSVSFFVVRRFGGRALAEMKSPLLRRMLAQLDTRPLRSVIMLRAVFGVAPFLNYALALSSLGFRDYLIGSAIGMAAPITVAAVILDAAL
jgi:uncharacterized membrane protein YdjX (TVP38/TMEM64 family)